MCNLSDGVPNRTSADVFSGIWTYTLILKLRLDNVFTGNAHSWISESPVFHMAGFLLFFPRMMPI